MTTTLQLVGNCVFKLLAAVKDSQQESLISKQLSNFCYYMSGRTDKWLKAWLCKKRPVMDGCLSRDTLGENGKGREWAATSMETRSCDGWGGGRYSRGIRTGWFNQGIMTWVIAIREYLDVWDSLTFVTYRNCRSGLWWVCGPDMVNVVMWEGGERFECREWIEIDDLSFIHSTEWSKSLVIPTSHTRSTKSKKSSRWFSI